MIEGIITAIAVLFTAFFFGLLVSSSRETSLDKKNFQLQAQNQILIRDIKKKNEIISMIKDNQNSVDFSQDKIIIFYVPDDDFDYEEFFSRCLND